MNSRLEILKQVEISKPKKTKQRKVINAPSKGQLNQNYKRKKVQNTWQLIAGNKWNPKDRLSTGSFSTLPNNSRQKNRRCKGTVTTVVRKALLIKELKSNHQEKGNLKS